MRLKSFISIILIIAVVFSFSACGGDKNNEATNSTDAASTSSTIAESLEFNKPAEYLTLGKLRVLRGRSNLKLPICLFCRYRAIELQ